MSVPSVIVVEDELDLLDSICGFLAMDGFPTRGVRDGRSLDEAWVQQPADILVLDLNLPGEDGLSISARMRRHSGVGIVMLTARSSSQDKITGLEFGADHYLTKPIILAELSATIRALGRRLQAESPAASAVAGDVVSEAWQFSALEWSLSAPNGQPVSLTAAEFRVVATLVEAAGRAVASDDILRALGKVAEDTNRGSLDSILSRLRRKIVQQSGCPSPIKSVRGIGYTFAAPVDRRRESA